MQGNDNSHLLKSPDMMYNFYLLQTFLNLNNETTGDGLGKEYEDILDDAWGGIPTDAKEKILNVKDEDTYLKRWKTTEDRRYKKTTKGRKTEEDKEKEQIIKRGRMLEKRQILTDCIASNKWFFKLNTGIMDNIKESMRIDKTEV